MMNRLILFVIALFPFMQGTYTTPYQEPVKVDGGLISGVQSAHSPVRSYKGIPYAAAPIGDLRWKPPQPVEPWEGVKQAYKFSDGCIQELQRSRLPWSEEFMHLGVASEDCLYLNVWTAAQALDEKRPVMVYIHGGGLVEGSTAVAVYNGEELAKKGVVLVTINYRLGVMGFMAHPELTKESRHRASGNYGLLDQVAALRWIQSNIELFGGNPDNVTIFGQSAGARSASLLIQSPLTKGLITRAIIQSGAQRRVPLSNYTSLSLSEAEKGGLKVQKTLGVSSLAALRQVEADRFLEPDIDRMRAIADGWFMPENLQTESAVPVMVGFVADDGFVDPFAKETPEHYQSEAKALYGKRTEAFLNLYDLKSEKNVKMLKLAAGRDKARVSIHMWAAAQQKKSGTVYTYYFNRAIPWPEHPQYGSFHTGEIPYVFNNLKMLDRPWESIDKTIADQVSSYWINFAKSGDPNGEGLPKWPAFDASEGITMHLGKKPGSMSIGLPENVDFWKSFFKDTLN